MYYLYETHGTDCEETPSARREWWWLVYKHEDKQTVLDWNSRFKRQYKRKLIQSSSTLKECFYPRAEILLNTSTSRMLKNVGYQK